MPPRLTSLRCSHVLVPRPIQNAAVARLVLPIRPRNITSTEKPLPTQPDEDSRGPNQNQLGHVSEEAADTAEIMGETAPEQEVQGTPVAEVLTRDEKAKENAPQVLKDESKESGLGENPSMSPGKGKVPSETRSYSTTTRRRAQELAIVPGENNVLEIANPTRHIFPLPELPIPSHLHMRHRYEPIVEQMTNLLMRDGKKAAAQRVRLSSVLIFSSEPLICRSLYSSKTTTDVVTRTWHLSSITSASHHRQIPPLVIPSYQALHHLSIFLSILNSTFQQRLIASLHSSAFAPKKV